MKTLRLLTLFMFAFSFLAIAACDDGGGNSNPIEICDDHQDNDNDGKIDCLDSDCASFAACQNTNNTNNVNNTNNTNNTNNVTTETNCADNVDNDNDGMIDCNDTDCANDAACATNQCTLDTIYSDSDPTCDTGFQCGINQNNEATCNPDANYAGGTFYGDCGANGECPFGSACFGDGTTNSCMPFCQGETHPSCPDGGQCLYSVPNSTINLCAKLEACDLVPNSCTNGEACYIVSQDGTTGCVTAGTVAVGQPCTYINDCVAESACMNVGGAGQCVEICRLSEGDADCSAGTCTNTGDATYGACQVGQ